MLCYSRETLASGYFKFYQAARQPGAATSCTLHKTLVHHDRSSLCLSSRAGTEARVQHVTMQHVKTSLYIGLLLGPTGSSHYDWQHSTSFHCLLCMANQSQQHQGCKAHYDDCRGCRLPGDSCSAATRGLTHSLSSVIYLVKPCLLKYPTPLLSAYVRNCVSCSLLFAYSCTTPLTFGGCCF